jgi:hypothetical protein
MATSYTPLEGYGTVHAKSAAACALRIVAGTVINTAQSPSYYDY